MPNEWTIDPSNPRQYIYTDEAGNVHRAPVYKEDVSVVQRDKNGNVTDVTFPNYTPSAGQSVPPAERRGWGDRFADSRKEAGQRGSVGVISRNGLYYSGYGKEEVARMFPNLSPEEQDKKRWELITATQNRMRAEADARRAADPTWKPDRTFIEQVASGDWIPDLAGQIFGGFGPENAIAPGSNTAQRVIGQGVIGGVTNAASQGADIHDSVADEFDPAQVGMDVLASMGGQTILEGIGKVVARGKAHLFGEEPKADVPDAPAAPAAPEKYVIPVEDQAGIENMLRSGASLDDIKAKYPRAVFGKNGTTLQWYVNNRGKWKKVNWTGEEAPGTALDLKPSEAIGPNGERVEVLPDRLDDGDGRGYREFRIRDANGDVTHQGEIYDNGMVAGKGELPVDPNFVRFAAKGQESLDNLAPGSQVDPTKSAGMSENIDPELAAKFDEEFGAAAPVGRHNPDNFVEPVVSPSGKFTHEVTGEGKNGTRQVYAEFTPDGADSPLEIQVTIDKDGSATINIETKKIDTATEHAGKTGPDAVREGLDEVLEAFPDIKEIKGIRKVGDRTGRVEREQKIPASVVERMRKRATKKVVSLHNTRIQKIQKLLDNPETSSMKEISDAIDYLDEAYAQGLDVGKLQDDLMKLEEYRYQKASPQNDNTAESLTEKAIRHEDDYVKLAFHDERRFLEDTNSPEYKQWEKEVDEAEIKAFESAKEQLRAEDPSYVDTIVEQNKGMAGPYRDAARAIAEENAAKTTPVEDSPVLDHAEPAPPVTEETISRLTESLKKAGKATDEQKTLNTQTRKERFQAVGKARHATSGEAGLAAEMAQLKGEFPKVVREPVRQDFSQEEVDGLFDAVKKNPTLSWGESIRARVGLYKLLDGHPISSNEISLLGRVFPKDFVKAAMKHRSVKGKIGDVIGNTLNLPRSLMSSFDLSAPFRQAWFFSTKKEFWKALPGMFRQAFSEKTFEDVMKEIRLRPNYERMESSGLSFSDLSSDIHAREEAFISNYAEKIPGVGKIVRGSERGFTGFLNKVRADVFDDLAAKAKAAGHDIDDPQFLKDLSGFINNATGRGSLGKFSQAGPFLNGLFFSPRLISSRLSLLNPVYYATLDPFVRKEAIKQLMATSALSVSVLTLAAAGGLNVEADPRSTDFGKIRDGDTRYDVLGGFGQYITLFARLATNQQKNSKGEVDELGKGFGAPTRLDILGRFATGKASPIAGYTASYLRGKDPTGKEFEAGPQAMDLFIPLFLQDVRDVMADEGPEGLKKAIPSFFGVGVSAYNNAPPFDRLGQQNDKQGGRMPGGFFTGDPANKPVVDELARIEAATGKELYKPVSKKDVKDFQMTDEQFYNYQYYAGAYIREDLKQVFASPEYQQASEEDKVKMVKEVVKDQKANARDLLFPKQ